jgi:MYXO-CTERM domain-containing protein
MQMPDGGLDASGDAAATDGSAGSDRPSNPDGSANADGSDGQARPDGAVEGGGTDNRADNRPNDGAPIDGTISGDGSVNARDGAGADEKAGEAGIGTRRFYLAGGGCQCDLGPVSTPPGAALALVFGLMALLRRRRPR